MSPTDESLSLLDRMEGELRSLRTLASERASLSIELAARREELERREAELQELERRTDQREAELETARQQLSEERERVAAELRDAEARMQEIERRAAEIVEQEQRVNQRSAEVVEHEQRVNQRSAEMDQQMADLERRREALELRAAEIEARETSVSSEHEEVSRLRAQVDSLREELSRTRTRLAEAGRLLEEHRSAPAPVQAASAPTPAPAPEPEAMNAQAPEREIALPMEYDLTREFLELRRERLKRVKSLLRGEAEKVTQVKDALKRRQKELQKAQEQIVEKQKDLQKVRDTRDQAERMMVEAQERSAEAARIIRRAEMKAAKGKASMFVAGVLISLAVVCGASWLVAGRVAPATYLASTTMALDARDANPTPEQIDGWRQFLVGLAEDPQFLDRAAERLRARGFEELGTPTDLRHALANRLEATSDNADRLTLTLRGVGAGRTERALETLTTSMVAYANDTRQLRADQSSTRVVTQAAAEGAPIDDPRLAMFGMIAGAASGVVLIIMVFAWRSLRSSVGHGAEDIMADEAIPGAIDTGLTEL